MKYPRVLTKWLQLSCCRTILRCSKSIGALRSRRGVSLAHELCITDSFLFFFFLLSGRRENLRCHVIWNESYVSCEWVMWKRDVEYHESVALFLGVRLRCRKILRCHVVWGEAYVSFEWVMWKSMTRHIWSRRCSISRCAAEMPNFDHYIVTHRQS